MMTRKDYRILADVLRGVKPLPMKEKFTKYGMQQAGREYQWIDDVVRIAEALSYHNSNFDKVRFLAACGHPATSYTPY